MNRRALILAACIFACGDEDGRGASASVSVGSLTLGTSVTTPSTDSDSATSTADTEPPATSASTMPGTSDPSGPKFDLPETTGSDLPPTMMGCQKVDVLLAVDNSGSMQEEIAALAGPVFDDFPQQLLAVNGGLLDFQLGVIDACNDPPYLHNTGDSGDCNFANGANYMVSSNPALQAEYSCVTQLTTSGYNGMPDQCSGDNDDEQPANTSADAALDLDGMNVGFVRDDAVLLIVAITDEDEQPVPVQNAQAIADKIVAAKTTIENVVFLGIGGDSDCEGPYGGANEAAFLREITQIFVDANRGLWWDLCQGNLEMAFASVVDVVDVACSEFVPEG